MSQLLIGAIGVVYGDIGTSPLYTLRQCFEGLHPLALSPAHILGVLSIIFWSLVIIVTLKYVALILRADNRGEGGILALTALVTRGLDAQPKRRWWLLLFGIVGAAMFYGDGMITPAISVLGAVEGLEVLTPRLHPVILPLALVIITTLFMIQRSGTARVGAFFGPVMVVWFVALAVLGLGQIIEQPAVLAAINPTHAIAFIVQSPRAAFLALGAVVLAVTGTEALYADMGHFGRSPIRRAWLGFVMPALVLNYFGQGALLLADPAAIKNPFYLLAPTWALVPLILLATCAAVIASQAVISGAFSLTRAAIQMGYCPRLTITHTSDRLIGQIYVPFINWVLFISVMLLVLGFRHSDNLGGAYGIAVTLAMLIDSILIFWVMARVWKWSLPVAIAIATPLALIDLAFLASNALKIPSGGWFPIVIAVAVFTLLTTWKTGRSLLMTRLSDGSLPLDDFIESIELDPPVRVPGTAVFLTSAVNRVPHSLLHNLKHNKVLHERVVFLTIVTRDIPYVTAEERFELQPLGGDFFQLTGYFGFSEDVDVPRLLEQCGRAGVAFSMMETSFFVSRESLIATGAPGMAQWRERLFVSMSKNATKVSDYFGIPTNRVVELGTQVEI
ncbi:MAG TPA: potassium transporter Kup [Pseudomonadales bacterium]